MKPLISPLKSIIRTVLSQNIISALIMSSSLVVGSSDSSSSTPTNSIYNIKLRPVAKHQSITAVILPTNRTFENSYFCSHANCFCIHPMHVIFRHLFYLSRSVFIRTSLRQLNPPQALRKIIA